MCPTFQAVGWVVPMILANTVEARPLLELVIRYIAISQVERGSFVACSAVLVVTVNCRLH